MTSTQLTSGVWYGKAELDTLRPSTQYMVQVRIGDGDINTFEDISKYGHCPQVSSLNNEGYSKFSEVTFFTTSKEGNGNRNVNMQPKNHLLKSYFFRKLHKRGDINW